MDTSTSSASARRPGGYAYTSGSKIRQSTLIHQSRARPPPLTVAHRTLCNIFLADPSRAVNVVRARHLTVMFTLPGQFKV